MPRQANGLSRTMKHPGTNQTAALLASACSNLPLCSHGFLFDAVHLKPLHQLTDSSDTLPVALLGCRLDGGGACNTRRKPVLHAKHTNVMEPLRVAAQMAATHGAAPRP